MLLVECPAYNRGAEVMAGYKLSASALTSFLKSPRQYYWRYIARLEPITKQVANYDHDIVFGQLWAEFTDRFYKCVPEAQNSPQTMQQWMEATEGWVPEKARQRLTEALETLMPAYYQTFSPDDGARAPDKSELWIENDRFVAKLDGLSDDRIIHEVKSTSRAQSIHEQLWKVQNSIQVKLYCVVAQAKGSVIEFAYKDKPSTLFRGPVEFVKDVDIKAWEQGFNALADRITSLGDDINNYPCNTDSCCMTTKYSTSMCAFQVLCTSGYNDETSIFYKIRASQQDKQKKEACHTTT